MNDPLGVCVQRCSWQRTLVTLPLIAFLRSCGHSDQRSGPLFVDFCKARIISPFDSSKVTGQVTVEAVLEGLCGKQVMKAWVCDAPMRAGTIRDSSITFGYIWNTYEAAICSSHKVKETDSLPT